MRFSRWCVPLLLGAAACQAAPAAITDADRAAIEAKAQAFTTHVLAGDFAVLVKDYYADDAVLLPPNMKAATGHAAMEAAFRTFPPVSSFTLHTVEIVGSPDLAYVRGTYTMTFAPPGAPPIPDEGKYLEVWRKGSDGTWKSVRDMFNSDMPMPEPAKPAAGKKKM